MTSEALNRPASVSLAERTPRRNRIKVGPFSTRTSEFAMLRFCGSNLCSVAQPRRVIARRFGLVRCSSTRSSRVLQARSPVHELMMRRNRFADLHRRLLACPEHLLANAKHRFQVVQGILRVLEPEATF